VQSYEKLREEQNKSICFFFRDKVTSRLLSQSYEKASEMQKENLFFFNTLPVFPSASSSAAPSYSLGAISWESGP
jgi:hypothetical protein